MDSIHLILLFGYMEGFFYNSIRILTIQVLYLY